MLSRKDPRGHGTGDIEADGQYDPAGHATSEGVIVPVPKQMLPAGHGLHTLNPRLSAYVPAGHGFSIADPEGQ